MFGVIEGTGFEIIDERFAACIIGIGPGRAAVDRRALERRAGLVSRPAATWSGPTSPTTG